MGCMSQCSKYFLCFFNFVFFIAGGAAFAAGIWLIADKVSFINLINKVDSAERLSNTDADVIKTIAYILIVAGALTFIVSFLGYCGAMFESRCLLCVYGILIVIVVILECVVVGLAYGLRGDAEKVAQDLLKSTIQYYSKDKSEAVNYVWDNMMTQMKCCGVTSSKDFPSGDMPEACCMRNMDGTLQDQMCTVSPSSENSYKDKGCYIAVAEFLKDNAAIVITIAAALVFIEVIVIIMALYLACCYWRPHHVYRCVEPPGSE